MVCTQVGSSVGCAVCTWSLIHMVQRDVCPLVTGVFWAYYCWQIHSDMNCQTFEHVTCDDKIAGETPGTIVVMIGWKFPIYL